jgi:DNA-binding CsgD family transcriptional regulator
VFHRLLLGDSEKQVAGGLGVSANTVHEYIKQIYRRFNVSGPLQRAEQHR